MPLCPNYQLNVFVAPESIVQVLKDFLTLANEMLWIGKNFAKTDGKRFNRGQAVLVNEANHLGVETFSFGLRTNRF